MNKKFEDESDIKISIRINKENEKARQMEKEANEEIVNMKKGAEKAIREMIERKKQEEMNLKFLNWSKFIDSNRTIFIKCIRHTTEYPVEGGPICGAVYQAFITPQSQVLKDLHYAFFYKIRGVNVPEALHVRHPMKCPRCFNRLKQQYVHGSTETAVKNVSKQQIKEGLILPHLKVHSENDTYFFENFRNELIPQMFVLGEELPMYEPLPY
jgi:hypothetical protein